MLPRTYEREKLNVKCFSLSKICPKEINGRFVSNFKGKDGLRLANYLTSLSQQRLLNKKFVFALIFLTKQSACKW